jgi:hypothetical protein
VPLAPVEKHESGYASTQVVNLLDELSVFEEELTPIKHTSRTPSPVVGLVSQGLPSTPVCLKVCFRLCSLHFCWYSGEILIHLM